MPPGGWQVVSLRKPPLAETMPACLVTRQKTCFLAFMSPVHTIGRPLLTLSRLTSAICSRWPISRHFWALPRTSAGFWKFMK